MNEEFADIILINDSDSAIMKHQQLEMNKSKNILLDRVYQEGITCICNKKIVNMHSHINSSRHKRFCNKHGINIIIKQKEKKQKIVKLKGTKKIGRPRIHSQNETIEEKRERYKQYTMRHLDKSTEIREKHNARVASFREANRELCRQRVIESRRRKKEKEKEKLNKV